MRDLMTRERLRRLLEEISRSAPPRRPFRVYLVGGGSAVYAGWREASIDADLFAEDEDVFRDVQGVKERVNVNVEIVRPEYFVPALRGSADRHVFLETVGKVSFFHYDPYAQVFAKVVRGFDRDLDDARAFVRSGLFDPARLRALLSQVPDSAFSKYPSLSPRAVRRAVDEFLGSIDAGRTSGARRRTPR